MRRLILVSLVLAACGKPDVPPTIEFRSPLEATDYDGYAKFDVRVSVTDERNAPVTVEVLLDGEVVGTAQGEGCKNGCLVTAEASTEELPEGTYMLTVAAIDTFENRVETPEEEAIPVTIWDIPYLDGLAVHNTQESIINGPDIEVEVHLLDEESARYRGCAAANEVQEDDLPYDELRLPFVYSADGDVLRYADIAFTPVRIVVIESNQGNHCPDWPELTELYESDIDQLYGISPGVDLSILFNEESVVMSNRDFSNLIIKKGRPINAD